MPRYLDISAIFLTDTWSIIFTYITSKQAFSACLVGLTEQQLSNVSASAAIASIFVFLRPPATATYNVLELPARGFLTNSYLRLFTCVVLNWMSPLDASSAVYAAAMSVRLSFCLSLCQVGVLYQIG